MKEKFSVVYKRIQNGFAIPGLFDISHHWLEWDEKVVQSQEKYRQRTNSIEKVQFVKFTIWHLCQKKCNSFYKIPEQSLNTITVELGLNVLTLGEQQNMFGRAAITVKVYVVKWTFGTKKESRLLQPCIR